MAGAIPADSSCWWDPWHPAQGACGNIQGWSTLAHPSPQEDSQDLWHRWLEEDEPDWPFQGSGRGLDQELNSLGKESPRPKRRNVNTCPKSKKRHPYSQKQPSSESGGSGPFSGVEGTSLSR